MYFDQHSIVFWRILFMGKREGFQLHSINIEKHREVYLVCRRD